MQLLQTGTCAELVKEWKGQARHLMWIWNRVGQQDAAADQVTSQDLTPLVTPFGEIGTATILGLKNFNLSGEPQNKVLVRDAYFCAKVLGFL